MRVGERAMRAKAKVIRFPSRDERIEAAATAKALPLAILAFITRTKRPVTIDEVCDFVKAEFNFGLRIITDPKARVVFNESIELYLEPDLIEKELGDNYAKRARQDIRPLLELLVRTLLTRGVYVAQALREDGGGLYRARRAGEPAQPIADEVDE